MAVSFVISPDANAQASASTFGARHQLVLSAEHLAGFTHTSGNDASNGKIDMWLFGAGNRPNPSNGLASPYAAPRAGVDFFVTGGFSLGTSLLLSKLANPSSRQIVVGPRVGAALPLGPRWNLWARLGFTWVHQNDDYGLTQVETDLYAITVEAPFLATIGGNFFVSLAPTANVAVGGSRTSTSAGPPGIPPSDLRYTVSIERTELGLQAALGGFL
jgi:hypothetical protein